MSFLNTWPAKIAKLDKDLDWSYTLARSWLFYNVMGGYKCGICGMKHLRFKTGEASSVVNGKAMIISWSANIQTDSNYKTVVICPLCFIDAIDHAFIDNENVSVQKCDWFKTESEVIGSIDVVTDEGIDIMGRFGAGWWNGFHASKEALIEGVRQSTMCSSSITYKNGKTYYNAGPYCVTCDLQTVDQFIESNNLHMP